MRQRSLFLLGSDTGVGKTTVACGLLRLAKRRGFRLLPFKPVESGCTSVPTDGDRLVSAAALPDLPHSAVGVYRFPEPLAPSIAARLANRPILPDAIIQRADELASHGDALLIESAGGVLTPYGPSLTSASLAEAFVDHFGVSILLVTANRLGTINQTALAIDHLRRTRCPIAGIVLVDVQATSSPDQPFNAHEIRTLTGMTVLGTLRHCPTLEPDAIADALAAAIDLRSLFGGALVAPHPPRAD